MPFPAVNPALSRALAARDYAEPTPVQTAVLEAEVGRDMLVSAQTGSGKTVAFGLALATGLLGDAERFERAAEPLALIIAPTRELAMQVQRELEWLYAETGARIATCVGGMDPKAERIALGQGAHIVVGTPGRLRDHLERRRLDLSKLRAAVLDEADEMLDMGFRDDLQFILDATPAERQTLMFSATVPREIENLARSYQRQAIRIETLVRNQQHDDIEYRAVRTPPYATEQTVVNLLRFYDSRAALVFCATREGVRRMHAGLAGRGFQAVAISGELSQAERTDALAALRDGRARVLVATDVAARGLDLAELSLVIHADLPNDKETLLHRSGRTGRAGRKGTSILIIPPSKRRRAEEMLGRSRINVTWGNAPTAKEIAEKDQERLMAMPILDELATAEDLALGRLLLDGRTPEQVAAALIRMHRATLPVAENIKDHGRPPVADRAPRDADSRQADRAPYRNSKPDRARADRDEARPPRSYRDAPAPAHIARSEDARNEAAPSTEAAAPAVAAGEARESYEKPAYAKREPRPDYSDRPERPAYEKRERRYDAPRKPSKHGGDFVWFALNIGREKNADPRWILPMLCRMGDITKSEIGSIRVGEGESRFEIRADHADNFANAVRLSKHKEGRVTRIEDGSDGNVSMEPRRAERAPDTETPKEPRREPRREPRSDAPPRQQREESAPSEHRPRPAPFAGASKASADGHLKRKHPGGSSTSSSDRFSDERPAGSKYQGKKPFHSKKPFGSDSGPAGGPVGSKPRYEGGSGKGKPAWKSAGHSAGHSSGKPSGKPAGKYGGGAKRDGGDGKRPGRPGADRQTRRA